MSKYLLSLLAMITVSAFAWGAAAQLPSTGGAEAETAVSLPDPLTPEAVQGMVARMSDAEVRDMLLERLDAVAKASDNGAAEDQAEQVFLETMTFGVLNSIAGAVSRIPDIWSTQAQSIGTFYDNVGGDGLLIMVAVLVIGVGAGLLAEMLFLRTTRKWHARFEVESGQESLWSTVKFLFNRLCSDLLGVVVFYFSASWIGGIVAGQLVTAMGMDADALSELRPYIMLIWTNLILFPRIAAAILRFVLAPNRPEFRLVYTDDQTAKFLFKHLIGVVILMGAILAIVFFNQMNGIPIGTTPIGFWLTVAQHAYLVYIVVKCWDGLVMMMKGSDPDVSPIEARVARAYPYFAIVSIIGAFYLLQLLLAFRQIELAGKAPHFWTMVVLLIAPALDTLIRGLVKHLVPPMTGQGALAERAYISTKRSWIRIGRVIVFGLILMLIARFWHIDFTADDGSIGTRIAAQLFEILIILASGYLIWELVSLWINRKLAAEQTAAAIDPNDEEPGGGEGGQAGGSRLSTVLPLVLGMMQVAIAVIFILIALGNIGIDITPLLAGAGILGLAIGFGAQKLVSDVVSGIFFLVDDAFRTGEFVEVEGTVGTVEKISIRSMQLRHHKGPVHTIPYGEIPKLTNYSRDWVIMKLKFTVPFETDPNKVKKIFKQIGKDMMEVPEFAADLLQPFKSQGVFDFDDVGMIMRGKFMAKPGRQFVLRKEIYNRVKKAFQENGIDFARREVRIAIPGMDSEQELNDEQKQALAAGAAQAAQDSIEANAPGPAKS